jgi:hypothetical protein
MKGLITGASAFFSAFVLLVGSAPTALGQVPAQPGAAVPEQFRPLYHALDELLSENSRLYPLQQKALKPLISPNLCLAASVFSPSLSDTQRWQDLLATLDAYKAMGMNAVLVQIVAPDLALGDTDALLNFYRRLAAEIRHRHMTLYIEHFVNNPFKPNGPQPASSFRKYENTPELKDDPEGRAAFLKILEQEVTPIYREIKPDYLSILTEPEVAIHQGLHLTFSTNELANWVGEVSTRLKASGSSPATLLGAGGVTVEPQDFFLQIAKQPSLDYLDMHLYIVKMKGEDQITKLTALIHKVREARPDMKVTLGEAWLFKQTKEGPKATLPEIFSRDNFSFWSPLDVEFLKLLIGMAQKEKIPVVVPYFSQYLFTYYNFGDSESANLPQWPACVRVSWNRAVKSIHNHQLSPTGQAMRAMLDEKK